MNQNTTDILPDPAADDFDSLLQDFNNKLEQKEEPKIESFLTSVDPSRRAGLFRVLLEQELKYKKYLSVQSGRNDQVFAAEIKSEYMLRFPEYADIVVPLALQCARSDQLGDYVLLEEIGRGGMGVVYRGVQKYLNQLVAIKVLPTSSPNDDVAVLRFQREMFLVGSVSHPNVVRALYAGEQRGSYYLVMELIEGDSVSDLLRKQDDDKSWTHIDEQPRPTQDFVPQAPSRMPVGAACEIVRQATHGLIHLNSLGLVHRDIKPGNLMINHQHVVKLLDLGLGKFDFGDIQKNLDESSLTHLGTRMGTADYMAPEQWDDAAHADIRSDIYSLGCSLYFMLTGNAPFAQGSTTIRKKMAAHLTAPIPSLKEVLSPNSPLEAAPLDAVFQRMLAKEPEDRFQTPEELLAAIEPFADRHALANFVQSVRQEEYPQTVSPPVANAPTAQKIAVDDTSLTLGKTEAETIGARGRTALLWLVAAAFFMNMLDGTILNTSLPTMAKYFGQSPLRMQSVVIAYMLTVALLIPISGWLADRFGTRIVFLASIIIFCAGSLCCALSPTLPILVLSRIFQGIGGSMMVPVGRLIVLKAFPKKELVRAMNIVILPAMIGPLLGPTVGGLIVMYATWHWIFLINLPIGLAVSLAVLPLLPDFRKRNPPPFDWIGATLFCMSTICILLTLEGIGELHFGVVPTLALAVAGAVMFLGYWAYAFKEEHPLFSPKLFRHRGFTIGILGGIFARLSNGSLPFLMPLLFQVGFGYSPLLSALTLLPLSLAAFLGRAFIERLLNRFGYRRFLIINTVMLGLLIMGLAVPDQRTPYWLLLLYLGILGICNTMQFTAMNTLSLLSLPREEESSGNSLLSVVIQVSLSLGIAFAAMILGLYGRIFGAVVSTSSEATTELILRVFHITFLTVGVIGVAASLIFFWTPKHIEPHESELLKEDVARS